MGVWTHSICDGCWVKRDPGRVPHRAKQAEMKDCCFCGSLHRSGIYVRHNPNDPKLQCGGEHSED